jgi:hypothetical protein
MAPTLTSFPPTTFLISSMSCHTLERLALARFLIVLAVLFVGLASTSTGEEAEAPAAASLKAPTAASLEPRPTSSEFMVAVGLWSTSTIGRTYTGAIKVEVINPDEEAPVLRSGT